MNHVLIPVSYGELLDKITILEIKHARIGDDAKRANVARELALLDATWRDAAVEAPDIAALKVALSTINARLWDVEEGKRDCERRQDFGPRFIALAREVYVGNDERARIKRAINLALGSTIVEEKSYGDYRSPSV